MKPPFPWFGRKHRVAPEIWRRFGNVRAYIEPFCGSCATLLARPGNGPWIETVNDADGLLVNFWRAVKCDPEAVAAACSDPPHELTYHARHTALRQIKPDLVERLRADPEFCDAKAAGWWVWGQCLAIGGDWQRDAQMRSIFNIHDGCVGRGIFGHTHDTPARLRQIGDRIKNLRITCGDWRRTLGRSAWSTATRGAKVGILLDPPYRTGAGLYAGDDADIYGDVIAWALEHGDISGLRIAVCGYASEGGEALVASGWSEHRWSAGKGYGDGKSRHRERVWFSPHCLDAPTQGSLF